MDRVTGAFDSGAKYLLVKPQWSHLEGKFISCEMAGCWRSLRVKGERTVARAKDTGCELDEIGGRSSRRWCFCCYGIAGAITRSKRSAGKWQQ